MITNAQAKTLATVIAHGGEMNAYAGIAGFYCNSVKPLVRAGLLEQVADCAHCATTAHLGSDEQDAGCQRPLAGQRSGTRCYARIRVTTAGRTALWAQLGVVK